jgi:hypothetical protein
MFFDDEFDSQAVKETERLLYSPGESIEDVRELMGAVATTSISSEPMRSPGDPAGVIPGVQTEGAWDQANKVQVDPYIESPILGRFWEQRCLPVEWVATGAFPQMFAFPQRCTDGKEYVTPANVNSAPDPPLAKRLVAIPASKEDLIFRIATATGLHPTAVRWAMLGTLLMLIPLVVRKR